MFTPLWSVLAQEGGRIPWWVWLILIVILLIILYFWFGREEEESISEEAPKVAAEDQPVAPAPEAHAISDDLKKIEGIGPKVSSLLNDAGITTFAQLADTDLEKIKTILDSAKLQYMDPTTWSKQAKLAANSNWEALEKLQDELKGGKQSAI